ncbi:Retrotransposable element Tf2 protein [Rhizoctonia solani]|uniref:Retrotransposable element Tf2 protein n=1 Tax=Rhizoctonia solani TaxID=456999 RepID=A0A8H8P5P7_9AGAM|nr:Retrotransposable element Tf2 protein [Rhizoctonia solani]QRW24366.1 Retrotransposable element Tf2 protein [Rhizoctonia solani]
MAEFAYNNVVHSSTGKTLFKELYGWEPTLMASNVPTDIPEADDLAKTMEAQWRKAVPIEFEVGKEAWLDAKNMKFKTMSPKLMEQCLCHALEV